MENQNDNTEMIKNLTNILEGLDNSQEQLEKNAFLVYYEYISFNIYYWEV